MPPHEAVVLDDLLRTQVRPVRSGMGVGHRKGASKALDGGAAQRGIDAKVGGTAADEQSVYRLLCQQEAELGVEEAVTGGLAHPAVVGRRGQIGVQLPARTARFQLGTRFVVLHIGMTRPCWPRTRSARRLMLAMTWAS